MVDIMVLYLPTQEDDNVVVAVIVTPAILESWHEYVVSMSVKPGTILEHWRSGFLLLPTYICPKFMPCLHVVTTSFWRQLCDESLVSSELTVSVPLYDVLRLECGADEDIYTAVDLSRSYLKDLCESSTF